MNILGINQVPGMVAWMHDSAAAVVVDGKIVATAEEERFNRIRHSRGNPRLAIDYCLSEAGLSIQDIDVIAIANNPYAPFKRLRPNLYPTALVRDIINIIIFEYQKRKWIKESNAKVIFVDHHLAHAASTYYCSGFDEANVITVDGSGETESFAFYEGKGNKLRRVWDIPLGSVFAKKKGQSIGGIYTGVTNFLSLGLHGEGKTMGLASYGKPTFDFSDILNIETHKKFSINRKNIELKYREFKREKSDPITVDHKNLAASLQKALEDSIASLAKEAYDYNKIENFAFAGGVTLNCNTNTKVLLEDFCKDLFVQPAANDGGLALGAALYASAESGEVMNERMPNAYYGPGYTNEEIEKILKNSKLKYTHHSDIEAVVAKLLTEGNIVSWFQGRMEVGPRALGNRSIIADPTIEGISDKINEDVKHREVWRPFAPSVAAEVASKYFEGVDKTGESPFMLHTFYVRDEYRGMFPAITHVDGSSRIQTVRPDQNKRYHTLLKEIEKLNGHAMVLNTSFNDKGEPIVCTPQDAIRCYSATGIDALAIGNFLLKKEY
ncbi:MAG: hypothetical protein KDD45_06120 [Bdellovibrionales bacterium]|nr:hypothetical protein [Bdellovibrionales bacterium]